MDITDYIYAAYFTALFGTLGYYFVYAVCAAIKSIKSPNNRDEEKI